jgi:hypothetical protein
MQANKLRSCTRKEFGKSATKLRESMNGMAIADANFYRMQRVSSKRWWLIGTTCVASLVLVSGCGPRSNRLAVSGDVTLDGAPLDDGSIRLSTSGTGKLYASGAMIKGGQFHIPQESGLPPGTYRVEISAPDTKVPPVSQKVTAGQPALPPTAPERIPAEYNSASKHTVEVTTGGDNNFKFEIASRAAR